MYGVSLVDCNERVHYEISKLKKPKASPVVIDDDAEDTEGSLKRRGDDDFVIEAKSKRLHMNASSEPRTKFASEPHEGHDNNKDCHRYRNLHPYQIQYMISRITHNVVAEITNLQLDRPEMRTARFGNDRGHVVLQPFERDRHPTLKTTHATTNHIDKDAEISDVIPGTNPRSLNAVIHMINGTATRRTLTSTAVTMSQCRQGRDRARRVRQHDLNNSMSRRIISTPTAAAVANTS